jgi:hypothetical protein
MGLRNPHKEVQWDYEISTKLEAALYLSAIRDMKATANKCSFSYTPYQLVKHKRPITPVYRFGELGLAHTRRKDSASRGEYSIFIGYGDNQKYYRVYILHRQNMLSRRKFVPTPTANILAEWNFKPRLQIERKIK